MLHRVKEKLVFPDMKPPELAILQVFTWCVNYLDKVALLLPLD